MVVYRTFGWLVLTGAVAVADILQLKDDASITGRIVAEKSEAVAVDVGYTILMVPRSAIAKIVTPKEQETEKEPKGPNTIPPASAQVAQTLYQNPAALRKDSTVRE